MSSWQAKRRFSGPTLRVTIGEPEGLDIVNTSSVANWGGLVTCDPVDYWVFVFVLGAWILVLRGWDFWFGSRSCRGDIWRCFLGVGGVLLRSFYFLFVAL